MDGIYSDLASEQGKKTHKKPSPTDRPTKMGNTKTRDLGFFIGAAEEESSASRIASNVNFTHPQNTKHPKF